MSIPLLYDQGPSDDHHYSSSHAAIAAESSQHNLNLLVSDSSVTTTTVVTARNINVHIVAFLEMANRLEASTNIWRRRAHSRHLISLYRSTGARPSWGDDNERDDESNSNTFDWSEKRSSLQLKRAQDREIIIPKR